MSRQSAGFEVFTDICLVCCVPSKDFADKATFVNVVLLKRRNAIAHGENTFVGIEDLNELANETMAIMRAFGDTLENNVCLKDYKSA
jgi:hypothetical protein